jgi:malate dehydrogenase (oxaloacetate-decarboxylating)
MPAPNASYSITMRVQLDADPGGIGRITTAVEQAAGMVTAVDVVESHPDRLVVDVTCNAVTPITPSSSPRPSTAWMV